MNEANKDLINYIESIPFGKVSIKVERTNRKTTRVTTVGEETLRYVDNAELRKDLDNMVGNLIESGFTGESHVKLTIKDGQVQLLSIYNQKETNY